MIRITLLSLLLCCAISATRAEDSQKLLEALRAELRVAIKKMPETNDAQNRQRDFLVYALTDLSEDVAEMDQFPDHRMSTLHELQAVSSLPKIRALCGAPIPLLKDHVTRETKTFQEKFDASLRAILAKGVAATSAKELDAPLADLAQLISESEHFPYQDDGMSSSRRHTPFSNALSSAQQVLVALQDVFLAPSDPSTSSDQSSPSVRLKQLMQGGILEELKSRSEFMEKLKAAADRTAVEPQRLSQEDCEAKVLSLINGITKLEDMAGVVKQIDALMLQQRNLPGPPYAEPWECAALRSELQTYHALRSSAAQGMRINDLSGSSDPRGPFGKIRLLMMRQLLPRVLQLPAGMAEGENEAPSDFLRRVLAAACANSDWILASRTLELAPVLHISNVAESIDLGAFAKFFAGLNQERAHFDSAAVTSYLAALETGSQLIPAEIIKDHLGAIKKRSPKDFNTAVKAAAQTQDKSPVPPNPNTFRKSQFDVLDLSPPREQQARPESAPTK